jgi:dihydrofolate reductase
MRKASVQQFARRLADARVGSGDAAEEIARLKQEPGSEIVAHGGARFVRSPARLEVADEYRLQVMPLASDEAQRCSGT